MHKGIHFSVTLALIIFSKTAIAQESYSADTQAPQSTAQPGAQNVALGTTRPLGLTQGAWNEQLRNRGQSKARPGYIRYVYDAQQALPIRAREGMITTIKVPEDEAITQAFVGDEAGFQIGVATPQSIVIKALFPGVDTNLIAYSESGKIYTFYLRSEGYNARDITDFLVDVIHPVAGAITGSQIDSFSPERLAEMDLRNPAAAAQRIRDPYATVSVSNNPRYREYAEWTDFDPTKVVEDLGVYVMRGQSGSTIPYRVFRDDRFTYVDYGPNAAQMTEWPTPLIVIQGVEGPVGNRTAGPSGRLIVIEALGEFVLRNGERSLVIKPRHTRTDPTLVEYSTFDPSPMRIPSELPPGQVNQKSNPLTVLIDPMTVTSGRNGEPSTIVEAVPAPDAQQNRRGRQTRRRDDRSNQVIEMPVARGKGAPIRTATAPNQDDATNAAFTGKSGLQTVFEAPRATVEAPSVPAPMPLSQVSVKDTHNVTLGIGTRAELEDRWRSLRVQYYTQLSGKTADYTPKSEGKYELRITPVTSAAEGVRICNTLVSEPNCSVRQNKQ